MKSISIIAIFLFLTISCKQSKDLKNSSINNITKQDSLFISSNEILNDDYTITLIENDKVNLWGKFNLNMPVLILNFNNKKTIKATTQNYCISSPGAYEQTVLTTLNIDVKNSDEYNNSSIVIIKKYKTVEFLDCNPVKTKVSEKEIDSLCKKIDIMDIYKDFDNIDTSYLSERMEIKQLNTGKFNLLLVSYVRRNDKEDVGTRYIILPKNKVFAISGPCTNNKYGFYKLDDTIYYQGVSFCCGCGQVVFTVYKIEEENVSLVYGNSDLSD